jgi:hypothetical protein
VHPSTRTVESSFSTSLSGDWKQRKTRGKKISSLSSPCPSLPASVATTAVNRNGGADRFASGKGLGFWLGDGDGLALDFGPREKSMISMIPWILVQHCFLGVNSLADGDGLGFGDGLCLGPGGSIVSILRTWDIGALGLTYCSTGLVSVTTLVSVSVV